MLNTPEVAMAVFKNPPVRHCQDLPFLPLFGETTGFLPPAPIESSPQQPFLHLPGGITKENPARASGVGTNSGPGVSRTTGHPEGPAESAPATGTFPGPPGSPCAPSEGDRGGGANPALNPGLAGQLPASAPPHRGGFADRAGSGEGPAGRGPSRRWPGRAGQEPGPARGLRRGRPPGSRGARP